MTLILLHSSGATAALWDDVVAAMPGIPVHAVTLPGRARVAWPPDEDGRDIPAYARCVLAFMDERGIEQATIAGHSLGGAIAMHLALEAADRVAGLGLSGTGARLRVWPHVLEGLADGVRDAAEFFANVQCGPNATDRERIVLRRMLEQSGMEQTLTDLRACDAFDIMDRVGRIRVRTQIFCGGHDLATPPRYAHYLADAIPAARLTTVPDAGHALPLEAPDAMAADLVVLWAATAPVDGRPESGTTGGRAARTRPDRVPGRTDPSAK